MVKYSRQRECILRNLQNRKDHPTADMVYESVRCEEPNISLGTVYRNLALLSETGQIIKITTGNGPDHFDGFTHPHTHFICKRCGNVLDLEGFSATNPIDQASVHFDGRIDDYELKFFGSCAECLSIKK